MTKIIKEKRIFIGSSVESLSQAKAIQSFLVSSACGAIVDIWNTQFPAGEIVLATLEALLAKYDGAIFIYAPNAECIIREKPIKHTLPNVIFETGIFIGRLGSKKVVIVKHSDVDVYSDINGVIYILIQPYPGKDKSCPLKKDAQIALKKWAASL